MDCLEPQLATHETYFFTRTYATAWWALKTRRNVLALTLIWVEVLVHAILGSLLIGWEAGFYYYLLMFIPALFAGNRSYRRAALTGVALWLFYVGLAVTTHLVEPVQPISENARLALLPGADTSQATQIAERVRQAVAGYDWSLYGLHAPVTLSIGISEHQPGEMLSDSLNRADAALYAGKYGGRNRVEVALETEQQSAAGSQAG